LLLVQALANVRRRRGSQDCSAAVLALYGVDLVVERTAVWEASDGLLFERVDSG